MAINSLPTPSSETAVFVIGGQEIQVPALTLAMLDRVREPLFALGPAMEFTTYAGTVVQIIAEVLKDTKPELTDEVLRKACSIREARELIPSMQTWLAVSGFEQPGEAEAAVENLGTGIQTPSPPNSPPLVSVEGTLHGSSTASPSGGTRRSRKRGGQTRR